MKTRRAKLLNSRKGVWFIGGTAARHQNRRHHLCRRRPISVVADAAISVAAVLTIPDGALVANPAATNLRRLCLPRRSHLRRRQLGRQLRRRVVVISVATVVTNSDTGNSVAAISDASNSVTFVTAS